MRNWKNYIQLLSFILLASLANPIIAQDAQTEYQKQYQKNIRKSRINQVYIPKTVEEACKEIIALAENKNALESIKYSDEKEIGRKLRFGLGSWISTNWNFDAGSRYSHLLSQMGITFQDDMVEFTIVSLHRHLNDKPLDIERRAKEISDRVKNAHLKKLEKAKTIDVIKHEKPKDN